MSVDSIARWTDRRGSTTAAPRSSEIERGTRQLGSSSQVAIVENRPASGRRRTLFFAEKRDCSNALGFLQLRTKASPPTSLLIPPPSVSCVAAPATCATVIQLALLIPMRCERTNTIDTSRTSRRTNCVATTDHRRPLRSACARKGDRHPGDMRMRYLTDQSSSTFE